MADHMDRNLNPPRRKKQCSAKERGFVWQEDMDAPILECQLDAGHKGSHVHPNLSWPNEKGSK